MDKLTHIDLFAGIGGFALGFDRAGIETLAHVEIDKACQAVLKRHWSDHIILSDVTDAGAHNLPYADIISYGSPCQDMSIAGKREGLVGKRSILFYEAARIIREINPRYSVWENVPGALSSNKGLDFKSVLEELLQTDVPMPRSGRWASAGMVRNGQKELAWRILDSQHFGVPQRRRRIFLVLCTRGDSAAEVLFEREGGTGNTPQSRKAGQGVAAAIVSRAGKGGFTDPVNDNIIAGVSSIRESGHGYWMEDDVSGTLDKNMGDSGHANRAAVIAFSPFSHYDYEQSEQAATIHNARQFSGSEHLIATQVDGSEKAATLRGFGHGWQGQHNSTNAVAVAYNIQQNDNGDHKRKDRPNGGMYVNETDKSLTVGGSDPTVVAYNIVPANSTKDYKAIEAEHSQALTTNGNHGANQGGTYVAWQDKRQSDEIRVHDDLAPTVSKYWGAGGGNVPFVGVRRLTPTECCRLQGFPDDWNDNMSDSARYRQLGNAVTVNVTHWIGQRIVEQSMIK